MVLFHITARSMLSHDFHQFTVNFGKITGAVQPEYAVHGPPGEADVVFLQNSQEIIRPGQHNLPGGMVDTAAFAAVDRRSGTHREFRPFAEMRVKAAVIVKFAVAVEHRPGRNLFRKAKRQIMRQFAGVVSAA